MVRGPSLTNMEADLAYMKSQGSTSGDFILRPTILVIDEDPAVRRYLLEALDANYQVLTAADGEHGLKLFSADVHTVIIDINMKSGDGFTVYSRLKSIRATVPFIFYTAFQSVQNLQDIINTFNPEGYIDKGRDLSFLKNLLRKAVHRYALILDNEKYERELEKKVIERTNELREAHESLKAVQNQMIMQGTMAATGRLAAGIAHNLRNPVEAAARNIAELRFVSESLFDPDGGLPVEGIDGDQLKILFAFIRKKYFAVVNLEYLDTRELKTIVAEFHDIADRSLLEIDGKLLKALAWLNVDAEEFSSLVPVLNRCDHKAVVALIRFGYKIGNNASVALEALTTASEIVVDTLDFANVRSQHEYHINDTIEQTLRLMSGKLRRDGIMLDTDFAENLPALKIKGNFLNQVFVNLISNAIDAMKEVEERRLEVETYEQGGSIYINFIDSGPGIPESVIKEVFEPFFTTRSEGGNVGMGLYTVYQIVKTIGDIAVESLPGRTKFSVRIDPERLSYLPAISE